MREYCVVSNQIQSYLASASHCWVKTSLPIVHAILLDGFVCQSFKKYPVLFRWIQAVVLDKCKYQNKKCIFLRTLTQLRVKQVRSTMKTIHKIWLPLIMQVAYLLYLLSLLVFLVIQPSNFIHLQSAIQNFSRWSQIKCSQ